MNSKNSWISVYQQAINCQNLWGNLSFLVATCGFLKVTVSDMTCIRHKYTLYTATYYIFIYHVYYITYVNCITLSNL